MPIPLRIDDLSREEKRRIQHDLIRTGLLKPTLPSGDPSDDGIFGPVTIAAYEQYFASRPNVEISVPIISPAPAEPWWVSGTHWSLLAGLFSMALGFAGMAVDTGELTQVLTMGAGTIWMLVGLYRNATRKNPIDRTLLARVGGHDVRFDRMPVLDRIERAHQDPRGHFGE